MKFDCVRTMSQDEFDGICRRTLESVLESQRYESGGDGSSLKITMPLYEYQCEKCGHRFEKIQKFSDKPIKKCPQCGKKVHQVISAPAVQFKGSGWYVTDYANKSEAPAGDGKESKKEDKAKSESSGGESAKESSTKESSAKESSSKESTKKKNK